MSMYIHEQKYKRIRFLKEKSNVFISWICPLLQPQMFEENSYIYLEGDDASYVHFLIKGQASFVLPKYENTSYITI